MWARMASGHILENPYLAEGRVSFKPLECDVTSPKMCAIALLDAMKVQNATQRPEWTLDFEDVFSSGAASGADFLPDTIIIGFPMLVVYRGIPSGRPCPFFDSPEHFIILESAPHWRRADGAFSHALSKEWREMTVKGT